MNDSFSYKEKKVFPKLLRLIKEEFKKWVLYKDKKVVGSKVSLKRYFFTVNPSLRLIFFKVRFSSSRKKCFQLLIKTFHLKIFLIFSAPNSSKPS